MFSLVWYCVWCRISQHLISIFVSGWNNWLIREQLKGTNIFLEGPKNRNNTEYFLEERWWFFIIFSCLLCRKSKSKILLASMKSLHNCEIPSSNPPLRACSCFLIAACVSKSCSVTRLWSWKLFRKPATNEHRKKSTKESTRKPEQKFDAVYGTIISKCFQRSKQKLHINFSL